MDKRTLEFCAVCGGPLGPGESVSFFEYTGVYVHSGCVYRKTITGSPARLSSWPPGNLHCQECGAWAEGNAWRWRAYIAGPDTEGESAYVMMYCPICAEREFGPFRLV